MVSRSRHIAYIECRTYGHAWDEYNPSLDGMPVDALDRITLRCTRCATTRHDHFNYMGDVIQRQYKHPDDYKIAKDVTPSRAVMRLVLHGHSVPRGVK